MVLKDLLVNSSQRAMVYPVYKDSNCTKSFYRRNYNELTTPTSSTTTDGPYSRTMVNSSQRTMVYPVYKDSNCTKSFYRRNYNELTAPTSSTTTNGLYSRATVHRTLSGLGLVGPIGTPTSRVPTFAPTSRFGPISDFGISSRVGPVSDFGTSSRFGPIGGIRVGSSFDPVDNFGAASSFNTVPNVGRNTISGPFTGSDISSQPTSNDANGIGLTSVSRDPVGMRIGFPTTFIRGFSNTIVFGLHSRNSIFRSIALSVDGNRHIITATGTPYGINHDRLRVTSGVAPMSRNGITLCLALRYAHYHFNAGRGCLDHPVSIAVCPGGRTTTERVMVGAGAAVSTDNSETNNNLDNNIGIIAPGVSNLLGDSKTSTVVSHLSLSIPFGTLSFVTISTRGSLALVVPSNGGRLRVFSSSSILFNERRDDYSIMLHLFSSVLGVSGTRATVVSHSRFAVSNAAFNGIRVTSNGTIQSSDEFKGAPSAFNATIGNGGLPSSNSVLLSNGSRCRVLISISTQRGNMVGLSLSSCGNRECNVTTLRVHHGSSIPRSCLVIHSTFSLNGVSDTLSNCIVSPSRNHFVIRSPHNSLTPVLPRHRFNTTNGAMCMEPCHRTCLWLGLWGLGGKAGRRYGTVAFLYHGYYYDYKTLVYQIWCPWNYRNWQRGRGRTSN